MNCIIVMVVLCILLLSLFNNDIIILIFLCNCYASYAYHIYILILIDEADRTAVGYCCLWEGTSLDPRSSTCLTLVTTWLAGQVKFHFQNSATSRWRMSNKTFFLRIYTYLLMGSCFYSLGSLHSNVFTTTLV